MSQKTPLKTALNKQQWGFIFVVTDIIVGMLATVAVYLYHLVSKNTEMLSAPYIILYSILIVCAVAVFPLIHNYKIKSNNLDKHIQR